MKNSHGRWRRLPARLGVLVIGAGLVWSCQAAAQSTETLRPDGTRKAVMGQNATCVANSSNHTKVNETSRDDDASYLEADAGESCLCGLGADDTTKHTLANLAGSGVIDSVRLVVWARSASTATPTKDSIKLVMQEQTAYLASGFFGLTSSYAECRFTTATKPTGGGWTAAAADSLVLGVKNKLQNLAFGCAEVRITQEYAVVYYQSSTGGVSPRRTRLFKKP